MKFDLQGLLNRHKDLLEHYSSLKVGLAEYHKTPYDLAIASARTCYSSKGIVTPEQVSRDEKSRMLRDRIAASTLEAGHMTTRQHAHFVFTIEGVSRHLIWQFLHYHPYYNSEQVSQRYVPVGGENWFSLPSGVAPESGVAGFHQRAIDTYNRLIELLTPLVEEQYFSIFRARKAVAEKYKGDIRKKAMEVARYVIPLSTTAYMYHTINALTLYRYAHTIYQWGSDEVIALVLKMVQAVSEVDPLLVAEIPEPLPEKGLLFDPDRALKMNTDFDQRLDQSGRVSLLAGATENIEEILNHGYQGESGVDQSEQNRFVHDYYFNPESNRALSDTLYPVTLDPQNRPLSQFLFTFQKKLSHTADSQEQRHRTLEGSRPLLLNQISLKPDYITPSLVKLHPEALQLYDNYMEEQFGFIASFALENGFQGVPYLLPNAFPVRFYESGNYLNFFHKWKGRLCYTAQEEIFYSALDEVREVRDRFPWLESRIGPPCLLRTDIKPRCPEGDRYCGVKVWKLSLDQYKRVI